MINFALTRKMHNLRRHHNYIMNFNILNLLFFLLFGYIQAFPAIPVDERQAGAQYFAYPVPRYGVPPLSPYPEGYEPFHLEHYGRHGSRWNLGEKDFARAVDYLQKAEKHNALSSRGKELLTQLKSMALDADGHAGEMTPLGYRQHEGIAQRMFENFPELFSGYTYLNAKSTESKRCILSMNKEVEVLKGLSPGLIVCQGSPKNYQDILNPNGNDLVSKRLWEEARPVAESYRKSLPEPDAFFDILFTDRNFVREALGEENVFKAIFELAVNVQSHDNYRFFYDIFSKDELLNEWKARNAEWYVRFGNTPITSNRTFFNQSVLLKNIIESADSAMLSSKKSINLRFGHDLMLLPLSVLMELDDAAYETSDLSSLADKWHCQDFFPMAGNIQMVFFRPSNGPYKLDDILVKVLLNEHEARLSVESVHGNYYRWTDLRNHYLLKLQNMPQIR